MSAQREDLLEAIAEALMQSLVTRSSGSARDVYLLPGWLAARIQRLDLGTPRVKLETLPIYQRDEVLMVLNERGVEIMEALETRAALLRLPEN